MDVEARATIRLFQFNSFLILAALLFFGLALLLTSFHVYPTEYLVVFLIATIYGWHGYQNLKSKHRQNFRRAFTLIAIAQMIFVLSVMTSITYVATAANLPLKDETLLSLDRAAGLDFRAYLDFINSRLWLIYILAAGYRAISLPIWVIIIVLPLTGHYRRTAEFICAFMISLIATTVISTLIPATGVYGTIGLVMADFPNVDPQSYYDGMREIPALRDGSLRLLSLFSLGGVLTFPSFHAISAILYAWALWPLRWLRPFNLACNGAMLAATPVGGGHYFADVMAGVGIAIISIYGVRYLQAEPSYASAPSQIAVSRRYFEGPIG
jgi:hypothetical protein